MQAKPCYSSVVVNSSLRSEPVDVLKIDHETEGEMDFIAEPNVPDKSASLVNSIKDSADLCTVSELAPNIRNMSMPEVTIDSRSHLSVCWPECGKCGLRDIGIDESVHSEYKVLVSSDHNICSRKQSATNRSLCTSSGLVSNECKEEDKCLSGHDMDGFGKDGLSHSQLKNITEREMLDNACILKSLNIDGENATNSSKENKEVKQHGSVYCFDECVIGSTILEKKENISEHLIRRNDDSCDEKRCNLSICNLAGLEGKFETSSAMQSALLDNFVEKVVIVPDDTSSKTRENEVDFSGCGDGDHDKTITNTINCESESFEVEGKMKKYRALPSQENAGPHLSNKFPTNRNPFAVEEEEKAKLNSYRASWESHLAASISPSAVQVSPSLLSEFTYSSKTEVLAPKVVDTLQTDPFLSKQVLSEQTVDPAMDHKKVMEESCFYRYGNSIDSVTLDKSMRIAISKSTTAGSHATNHIENQTPNNLGTSPLEWKSIGETHSDIPTQSLNQANDRSDKVNVNHSAAEMYVFTTLGPNYPSGQLSCSGSLSARASYSGQIPFSGSVSYGSESSTASTHSFAFPILPNEWNSSPVKMKEADSKYFERKQRGWFYRFCCFSCCRP